MEDERAVKWSPRAVADLSAIRAYVARDAPRAAERLAMRLKAAADGLMHFPYRGRAQGEVRELTTVRPYLIRYRVTPEEVRILRIRHGARRPLR